MFPPHSVSLFYAYALIDFNALLEERSIVAESVEIETARVKCGFAVDFRNFQMSDAI